MNKDQGKIFGLPQNKVKGDNMGSVADIDRKTNPKGTAAGNPAAVGAGADSTVVVIGQKRKVYTPAPDYWSAPEPKELVGHKLAPEKHQVIFNPLIKAKIDTLMAVYPRIEWLCYLVGKREGDTTHVTDLIIPTQKVTSVRVDDIELEDMGSLPIVGVMHSHHGMGNGFSGTDDEYINANHLLSLCISHGGINGQFRWNTPEGDVVVINAPVVIKYDFDFDFEEFVTHCKKNITEITYVHAGGYLFTRGELEDISADAGYNSPKNLIDDLNAIDKELIIPEKCPKCESLNIAEIPDSGWFCIDCGEDYYLEDEYLQGDLEKFNERMGLDDVPMDEQQSFDGVDSGWDTLEDKDYPIPLSRWREAEELDYILCEDCNHYYKPEDNFKGKHPVTHEIGDPDVNLCKECYCEAKYPSSVSNDTKKNGTTVNCWDTKSTSANAVQVQCAGCHEFHDYVDNYKTPIGNLCDDCYTKWYKG